VQRNLRIYLSALYDIFSPSVPSIPDPADAAASQSKSQEHLLEDNQIKTEEDQSKVSRSSLQPSQPFTGESTWLFRIEGYILDPSMQFPVACGKKFTEFVKKIVIEAENENNSATIEVEDDEDSSAANKALLFEWVKTSMLKETDGFELKGLKNGNLKIFIILDYPSDKFYASKQLQVSLGFSPDISTKAAFLVDLWRYISVLNLFKKFIHYFIE
jgi:hypothetical protein